MAYLAPRDREKLHLQDAGADAAIMMLTKEPDTRRWPSWNRSPRLCSEPRRERLSRVRHLTLHCLVPG